MKKLKSKVKQGHTSNSQIGHGDYYGTGIKNPVGKIRDMTGVKEIKPPKLKMPPRALA